MTTPKIGQPVRGSRTGRPVMVAMDLLGRRTAMRILWELRGEPLSFRALQEACETNSRLLNIRLAELKRQGLSSMPPVAIDSLSKAVVSEGPWNRYAHGLRDGPGTH